MRKFVVPELPNEPRKQRIARLRRLAVFNGEKVLYDNNGIVELDGHVQGCEEYFEPESETEESVAE